MDNDSGRTRRLRATEAADAYGGVLSRTMLRGFGVDRHMVRRTVRAATWRVHGRQTVAVHTATLSEEATYWRAIWEVGSAIAHLDGVSALRAAGLSGFTEDRVHVSIPHPARPLAVPGVRIHRTRRWTKSDLVGTELPRVRPDIAAVRAAHWAVSDRQAALILCMTVQQRLTTPARLAQAAGRATGRRRRAFVRQIVADIADGAQSLGELDFARLCRDRGLPEPDRQVVRQGARGRIYLDVRWDAIRLVLEIDGAQHRLGLSVSDDNLRQNAVAIGGDTVIRIDLVGFRLWEALFMDQVVEAHRVLSARVA